MLNLQEKRIEAAARAIFKLHSTNLEWDEIGEGHRGYYRRRSRAALLAADAVEGVAVVPDAERRSILRACLRIVRQTAEECAENDGPPAYWGARSVGLKIVEHLRSARPSPSHDGGEG